MAPPLTVEDRVNILLVDDQPAKLLTYRAILGDLGHNLIEVGSGREALEHLLRTDVAVVLVDVCMPDLDGFELAALIRQHPRCAETAIIFVSAVHLSDLDRLRGYECGAVDYVPVPVVPQILRARVGVFADLYRHRRQLERLNRELEQRVAERTAALEAADRRKDEFLAMLSHELRNPLAPIRHAVKVLELLGGADPRAASARAIIGRQVEHMASLVDDLMDAARLTQGRITLRREVMDLVEVVTAAAEASRAEIERHGHVFVLDCREPSLCVLGDAVRLRQVVGNLIANAVKFTPDGGAIRITLARDGDHAALRIADTGAGFAPAARSRIFELFSQEETTLARSRGGLGIGLTLVKRLVELHDGIVEASSDGPGRGSEFLVRIPLTAEGAARAPEPPAPPAAAAAGLRVLVVEDNVDAATSLATMLRMAGHVVEAVHDGPGALPAVAAFRPHVALVDLGLPELDGFEVARRIRSGHPTEPVLLAVSGYGREEDKARTSAAGFDRHLVKPVDPDVLLRCLAALPAARPTPR